MTNDFDIDMHRLHLEWEKQPKLYHEYATKLAAANTEVDRLKGRLELVAAQMELEVRDNPSAFGIKKVTESIVEKTVLVSAEYEAALKLYNAARAEARHLQALINTLDQRKTAVEYLTKLRLADYFADPRIPAGAREDSDEAVRKRVARAVNNQR